MPLMASSHHSHRAVGQYVQLLNMAVLCVLRAVFTLCPLWFRLLNTVTTKEHKEANSPQRGTKKPQVVYLMSN